MITIVAGMRDWRDRDFVYHHLTQRMDTLPITSVITGGARGVDTFAFDWAWGNGIPVRAYPANWGLHGKAAGPIRDRFMAGKADALIAFWDGESRGTKNMIEAARSKGLTVTVIRTAPIGGVSHD